MHKEDAYESRLQRRREQAAVRSRRQRKIAVIASVSLIAVVALGLAGWVTYTKVQAGKKPKVTTYKVTLPEGLTNKDVAERFASATHGSISAGEFMQATRAGDFEYSFLSGSGGNTEGFLFPDTYQVTSQTGAHDAVDRLLEEFGDRTRDLDWSRAAALGVTPHQIVTIASIIEKEVKVPEERPIVASVIYNRLASNMRLGMCSTVLYALGRWKPTLTNEDLEVDSPYNTYKVDGLPPGPICNPGFEAIRSALYPASTPYLYFILTNPDGHHSFTADYKQFEQWKAEQNAKQ